MKKIFYILLLLMPLLSFAEEEKRGPEYYQELLEMKEPVKESRFFKEFLNMLGALALVLGVLFLVLLFFKRFLNLQSQKANEQSQIKIIEQRALTPKTSLYLLDMGGQKLLIADSPAGVTLLSKVAPFTLET